MLRYRRDDMDVRRGFLLCLGRRASVLWAKNKKQHLFSFTCQAEVFFFYISKFIYEGDRLLIIFNSEKCFLSASQCVAVTVFYKLLG